MRTLTKKIVVLAGLFAVLVGTSILLYIAWRKPAKVGSYQMPCGVEISIVYVKAKSSILAIAGVGGLGYSAKGECHPTNDMLTADTSFDLLQDVNLTAKLIDERTLLLTTAQNTNGWLFTVKDGEINVRDLHGNNKSSDPNGT